MSSGEQKSAGDAGTEHPAGAGKRPWADAVAGPVPEGSEEGRGSSKVKARLLVAALVVAVLASLGLSYVQLRDRGPEEPARAKGAGEAKTTGQPERELGEISYPDAWSPDPAEEGDERAGVLLRLRRSSPDASFLLRRITGKLESSFSVEKLAQETEKGLSEGVQDFALVENLQFQRDGLDAVRIGYLQGQGSETFRTLLLVVPTLERTFYLTFRSPARTYPDVEREFDEITDNVFEVLREIGTGR